MTTCRDIITTALRKARQIASGETPSDDEAADGMAVMQGMYLGMVDGATFGQFTDVIPTEDYEALEGDRVRNDDAFTITIPTTYEDSDGIDRTPRDLSIIEVWTGSARQISVYDATVGAWLRLDSLTLDAVAPFATRNPDGLACALSMYLAEEYGAQVGPMTMRTGRCSLERSGPSLRGRKQPTRLSISNARPRIRRRRLSARQWQSA